LFFWGVPVRVFMLNGVLKYKFLISSSFGCGSKLSVLSCAGSDYLTKITFHDFDMTMQRTEE
jgi:hypothetical protein